MRASDQNHLTEQCRQKQKADHSGSFTRSEAQDLFENTACNKTSQQNSYVELAFTVIMVKTRVMMNAAQIPKSDHFKMWSEATMTVTVLDNLIPVTWKGETKT